MKKILFLIHDLGPGGAEKVLVNLVNNMDRSAFEISVAVLFGGGVNEQFLNPDIRLIKCFKRAFRGNSHIMKLFSPKALYRHFIKEKFDIAVSYLEGPSARIISGCDEPGTKKVCWIHIEQHSAKKAAASFRSIGEAEACYNKFDKIICVSEFVKKDFTKALNISAPVEVLYNTVESEKIRALAKEAPPLPLSPDKIKLCGVGKLLSSKGFDRLLQIHKRLLDLGFSVETYILGEGSERQRLQDFIRENSLEASAFLLGYDTNPYRLVSRCDIFVCSSFAEGFSTAATEALILGVPVVTTEVSGMREMLGENGEYGIVTENKTEALFEGVKSLVENPILLDEYRLRAAERGNSFSTATTLGATQRMLLNL